MEKIKTVLISQLVLVFVSIVSSCGGSGSGGSTSPASNGGLNQPVTLQNIGLSLSKTEAFNEDDPVDLEVSASYSDGSVLDITSLATITLDPPNIGSVNTRDPIQFSSPEIGTFLITASYGGLEDTQEISISDYVSSFELFTEASLLPVNLSIPILKSAWLRMSGDTQDISALEILTFESLDETIAKFEPKSDDLVFNPYRNPEIGHLHTKQPGTTTLTYSHNLTNEVIYHDIEVLPYRLLTTKQTIARSELLSWYNVYDVLIGDDGDTFFLSGNLQVFGYIIISQFSSATQSWLPDRKIQITPPNTQESFSGGAVELAASENFIITGWISNQKGVFIAIYDRNLDTVRVEKLDDFYSQQKLNVAIDSQERIVACWDKRCRTKPLGGTWTPIQNITSSFPSLKFSDNDETFLVYRVGETQLLGQKFTSTDNGLVADSPVDLSSGINAGPIKGSCTNYSVSPAGNFFCGFEFFSNTAPSDRRLYSISYHTDLGWQISYQLSLSDLGILFIWRGAIADNGNILLVYGKNGAREIYDKYYVHGTGWQERVRIGDTDYTPHFDVNPQPVGDDWKIYIQNFDSIMTRSGNTWTSSPFFHAFGHWAWHNSSEKVDFSADGDYAMGWNEVWAYYNSQSGYTDNTLYFLLPKYAE